MITKLSGPKAGPKIVFAISGCRARLDVGRLVAVAQVVLAPLNVAGQCEALPQGEGSWVAALLCSGRRVLVALAKALGVTRRPDSLPPAQDIDPRGGFRAWAVSGRKSLHSAGGFRFWAARS